MTFGKQLPNWCINNQCPSLSCSLFTEIQHYWEIWPCLSFLSHNNLPWKISFAVCDDLVRHHLQRVNPDTYLLTLFTLLHQDILFIMGVTSLAVISTLDNDSCQKIWVGSWGNSSFCSTTAKNYTQNAWPLQPQLSSQLQSRNLKFSELCPENVI